MTLRVLVVDDNEEFLSAAERLLDAEGLTIVGTTTDPEQAIRLTNSLRPDVALIDIKLGAMSGIDLARRLAATPGNHKPRIVLISTHAEDDFRDLIDASTAAGFVAKSGLSAGAILSVLAEG